jgi:D-serine deaminase-like pyridoxal phosphate-dependent protein
MLRSDRPAILWLSGVADFLALSREVNMDSHYLLRDPSSVLSPGLLYYKDLIQANIALVIKLGGHAQRIRPHVKTHKTREITRMELEAGITKQKVATIAEAELVASCGVTDILLAYNLVGPNCARMAKLARLYPKARFAVLADDPGPVRELSAAMVAGQAEVDVLLDIDVGQHRTGIAPSEEAIALYELVARLPGLRPGGLHVYDGHNHQESFTEREAAALRQFQPVLPFRAALEKKGLPLPRFVLGGTPTFPIYTKMDFPGLECSPGTCILNDHGYGTHFPDLNGFKPAALMLTRVISRPMPRHLTLDLGYKSIASDPPAGQRCILLNVPDYKPILQNEEHFVIETPAASQFKPGDVVYAMPTHICPTSALHKFAYVVENCAVTGTWEIAGRDRMLTV